MDVDWILIFSSVVPTAELLWKVKIVHNILHSPFLPNIDIIRGEIPKECHLKNIFFDQVNKVDYLEINLEKVKA